MVVQWENRSAKLQMEIDELQLRLKLATQVRRSVMSEDVCRRGPASCDDGHACAVDVLCTVVGLDANVLPGVSVCESSLCVCSLVQGASCAMWPSEWFMQRQHTQCYHGR